MVSPANFNSSGRQTGIRICLVLLLANVGQQGHAQQRDDAWFDADWEQQAQAVNEGKLEIFDTAPEQVLHIHHNKIRISDSSIDDGWVDMHQCHQNLDTVSALQIVFNKQRITQLKIISFENIEQAWVENNTVQLRNIIERSSLCVSARTRALHKLNNKVVLKNGPFMRRFLDGYYPMRVRMHITYPQHILRFINSSPVTVENTADQKTDELSMDIIFSGRLKTEFVFMLNSKTPQL